MTVQTARSIFHGPESGPVPDDLTRALANTIIEYFRRGLAMDDDTIFFAVSMLGITDERDIAGLLADADSYGEGLCDLIFAPPPLLRIAVEMLIPPEGLSAEACTDICGIVLGSLKNTRVSFGKTGHTAMVDLSGPIISRFVARLHLTRRMTFSSITDTAASAAREFYARARVVMRNARYTTSPMREKFLSEMVGRMVADVRLREEAIMDCLEFILSLFGEFGDDSDIYSLISAKRRSFDALLSDMADYQEYAGKYSMDFLTSNKIHRPAVDREDVMKKIYLSDLISMSMYGMPADSGTPR